ISSRPVLSISFSAPYPCSQKYGALSLQYINELNSLCSFALSPKAAANVQPFFNPPSFFRKKSSFFLQGGQGNKKHMNVALQTPFPRTPTLLR
ncbi:MULTISPECIES: hypothetical protein, partial [Arenibacter]|uniref:hypothetical protein n=1 Tax=Arenibacter TaxID=178469 RepID=UPI001965649A